MIKNKVVLEVKIGERIYEFYLSTDSPLGEIHDALQMMKSEIVRKIQENNAEPKSAEVEMKE